MTSPDEFHDLERKLTRVLRTHGDSIEPSPNAYARLAEAVDSGPAPSPWIRRLLAPLRRDGRLAVTGESLRPLAFLGAVLAVAGLGGYALFSLTSSPTDTATAAPATADVSDLVPRGDETTTDGDLSAADADRSDDAETAVTESPLADSADSSPRSSVPSESAASGTASATASNPVERYAGLTYAPVRVSGLDAAGAFLGVLGIDDVELEERDDRVIVRPGSTVADSADESILTTLTIGAVGDGFMVVEANSDRLALSIDNTITADPTADDIVDDTAVTAPLELSGTIADPTAPVTVAVRSVIDGAVLARVEASPTPVSGNGAGYRSTVAVAGAERVWVVATTVGSDDTVQSLAARPLLYTGRPDPASYTVVGLPPDDPDGGLVVRSAPGGEQVGVIELGSTGVRRRPVPPRFAGGTTWWAVADATGLEGWVAAPYLAVDETPAETTMVELARTLIAATDGDPGAAESIGLGRRLFVGSIVDPHRMSGLADVETLLTTRRRLTNGPAGGPATIADFYGFDRWTDAEVFVPNGYRQQGAAEGARAFFGDLPSVVIRSLNPATGGWERVHLFVSGDGDGPTLVGLVLEIEPPSVTPGERDESAAPPPGDVDG